jgi:hypothetical protein
MKIQLTISKALITEAVKSETYLRGRMVRASENGSATLSNDITVGDEQVDERKISRDISYAVEKLKTIFVDYITPSPTLKGNDAVDSSDSDGLIKFNLTVSTRWNGTLTDACARLSSRYIQDVAVMQWYVALGDKLSEYYAQLVKQDEIEVRKCFIKCPPAAPTTSYSTKINFQQPNMTDGSLHLIEGDTETITYSLDAGAIDDIETRSEDPDIVRTELDGEGNWVFRALRPGATTVEFYSRHNDDVCASCDVIVMSDPDKHPKNQHVGPSEDSFIGKIYR